MLTREFLFGRLVPDANDRKFVQVVAIVALLVRLMLGMTFLMSSLTVLMGGMNGGFGGPFGGGPGWGSTTGTGLDAAQQAIPYLQLVTGLGLLLGVFTFVWSVVAGLTTILPSVLICAMLVVTAGIPGGPRGIAAGAMFTNMVFSRTELLAVVLMIFFSHPSINRFSIDTLIFGGPPRRLPQHGAPLPFPEEHDFRQEVTEITPPPQ